MTMRKNERRCGGDSEVRVQHETVGYTHVLCCPCCEFCTLSSAKLHKHAEIHEPETLSSYSTYTCSKCLSTSTERGLMVEHVTIYHKNTQIAPVELKEEIHTITRREEKEESGGEYEGINDGFITTKSRRSEVERNLKNIKWKSRIKRIKNFSVRKWQNIQMLKTYAPSRQDSEEYYKVSTKEDVSVEDQPLDMTIKTQQKLEVFSNNGSPDDKPSVASSQYPSLYNNIKCHLLDMLTKSPLTGNISNPVLMRYLASHMNAVTGNKYFLSNSYLQRNFFPDSRICSTNDSLYQHDDQNQRIKIPTSKFPTSNSPSCGNSCGTSHRSLHRNNFTPFQNHILLEWYDKHKNKPYPSTEDTKHLSTLCALSYPQVKKWFANKRARSTFYQKNDMVPCDEDMGCDMLRFPLRVTNHINVDIARSMEAQFRKSITNKIPNGVESRMSLL